MSDAISTGAFERFLARPTGQNYRRARRLAMADSRLDPHSLKWAELSGLCENRRFRQVLQEAQQLWPQWRLSPRFHLLVAYAAFCLGEQQEAELARFQYQACVDGMLDSGDGTRRRPYQVLRICDEYDLLRALQQRPRSQTLVERKGRWLDVITCEEGRKVWFDPGICSSQRPLAGRFSQWIDRIPSQASYHS